jgi:hypothetical protein
MHSLRHIDWSHVFAAICNVIILTFLPRGLYVVLLTPANIYGDPREDILYSNLILAISLTLAFFLPLSRILDWLFQKVSQSKQRRVNSFLLSAILLILALVLVFGSFSFAIGIIFETPFILGILGEQAVDPYKAHLAKAWSLCFLLLGSIPLLLGGPTYWLLLQTSRKVLSKRNGMPGLREAPVVPAEIKSSETISIRDQWNFLAHWSIRNLIGWAVGLLFAFLAGIFLDSFEIFRPLRNSGGITILLICLPFGAGVGMLQWYMLRNFGIHRSEWTIVTSLGWSIGCGIWAMLFFAFYYSYWFFGLSDQPFLISGKGIGIIDLGLMATTSIGGAVIAGAIIGNPQLVAIRKYISRPGLWTRAYILGLLLPIVLANLIYFVKSFLKKILFSFTFLPNHLLHEILWRRWILVLWFSAVVAVLGISILTGRVLLKQSNIRDLITEKKGLTQRSQNVTWKVQIMCLFLEKTPLFAIALCRQE